jgi:acetate kinase
MDSSVVLISNPGSASRKYALYVGNILKAEVHFEWLEKEFRYSIKPSTINGTVFADIASLSEASGKVIQILRASGLLKPDEDINTIGLRIVAPGSYFLQHRLINDEYEEQLRSVIGLAPIHVTACLEELESLRSQFSSIDIYGASDSAFHATRPDYAKYYGVPIKDAEQFDIKRFGYHGLSVASVIRKLELAGKLVPKIIVVHIGGGASATAVLNGRSIDNTMGYSPLDGLTMSTRSGSIDPTAVFALKKFLKLDDSGVHDYLNNQSGLLGLGGSSEIPELIEKEKSGDSKALLALNTFIYNIQKGIAEMSAALGGIDALVLTGTVSERSAPIRYHITARLHYLDFMLDELQNEGYTTSDEPITISRLTHSKPIFVVPTNESKEILHIVSSLSGK